jgi:biotin operon repressor
MSKHKPGLTRAQHQSIGAEAQLAALGGVTVGELLAAKFPAPQEPPRGKPTRGIVQMLSERGALTRDDLRAALGGSSTALDAALMDLELDGYIEAVDGLYRIREYPDHDNA